MAHIVDPSATQPLFTAAAAACPSSAAAIGDAYAAHADKQDDATFVYDIR
jgi:hypothetical protein